MAEAYPGRHNIEQSRVASDTDEFSNVIVPRRFARIYASEAKLMIPLRRCSMDRLETSHLSPHTL